MDIDNSNDENGQNVLVKDKNDESQHEGTSDSNKLDSERITLTSRRAKKHVTIEDDSESNFQGIQETKQAIERLENDFTMGIAEIKKNLGSISSDKKSFILHIKSLEESLRKAYQEREKSRELVHQMKTDIEMLTAKLEAQKMENSELKGENLSLASDHEDHMKSIAEQHRKKVIAKKTLRKWKGKLRTSGSGSQLQMKELLEENRRLREELLTYQDAAKHAFLRSANILNTEALSLFQDIANRALNLPPSSDMSGDSSFRSSNSDTSVASHLSDSSNETQSKKIEKENYGSPRVSRGAVRKPPPDNYSGAFMGEGNKFLRKRSVDNAAGSQNDRESLKSLRSDSKSKSGVEEFVPDPLRRETREIMRRLETNKRENLNVHFPANVKDNKCHSKNHIHICHCTPIPDRPNNCSYCYANQNIKFGSMPIETRNKPRTGVNLPPKRRDKLNQYDCVSGDKSKVIYKPSGSTVVVEKHL